jgi:8-oxo-dGTP pyrophosphatase MutT (NUDIX family)
VKDKIYQIADELRAIANAGLRWGENGYDRERYERVLRASARLVAAVDGSSEDEIYGQYAENFSHLSPVLCVEAALFRDGKILLIQRSDDHTWAMPGGLLEVGESPAQGAERELWEEAGIRGRSVRMLAVYDTRFWPARTSMQLCIAQFLMEADGEPGLHSGLEGARSSFAETLDVGFFAQDQMPELHVGFDRRVPMAFQQYRQVSSPTYFDSDLTAT